jgi:hypothetical protein
MALGTIKNPTLGEVPYIAFIDEEGNRQMLAPNQDGKITWVK